jgi:hypothetical protein
MKAFRLYKGVKDGWTKNYKLYKKNPNKFFNLIKEHIQDKKLDYFRWQVGGDIPDSAYISGMIKIANECPGTKFMAFTKRFNIISDCKETIPANLQINLSSWNGVEIPKELRKKYRIAWFLDPKDKDPRVAKVKNIFHCPSDCEACNKTCWKLSKIKKDVLFIKH